MLSSLSFFSLLPILSFAFVQSFFSLIPTSADAHIIFLHQFLSLDLGVFESTFFMSVSIGIFSALLFLLFHTIWLEKKILPLFILSSVPSLLVLIFLHAPLKSFLGGSELVYIISLLVTGTLILFFDDYWWTRNKSGKRQFMKEYYKKSDVENITFGQAFIVGIVQLFSFIPGVSPIFTGVYSARVLGISKRKSLLFSLILCVPLFFFNGFVGFGDAWAILTKNQLGTVVLGGIFAYIVAHFGIKILLHGIKKFPMDIFGWYSILFASVWYLFFY